MEIEQPFYRDPRFVMGCRVFIGLFFLYTGASKIADPLDFAVDVKNYHLLPHWTVNVFALVLPWLEVVSGLCLITGIWTRPAAFLVCGMLWVFMAAMVLAIARGLNIHCGCFSGASRNLYVSVAEDALFFWMTFHVLLQGPGYRLERDTRGVD